jgi:excisionase family DNA binding protein
VAAQPSGKAATTYPSYLHTAEVADLLHVSPKTVSRWAKEGRLPFLKTLGGHRRYPEAEIRDLAEGLREEAATCRDQTRSRVKVTTHQPPRRNPIVERPQPHGQPAPEE